MAVQQGDTSDSSQQLPLKPEIVDDVGSNKEIDVGNDNASNLDTEKSGPIKGNDSNGKVDWNFKQVAATVSLSGLYVGRSGTYIYVGCLG